MRINDIYEIKEEGYIEELSSKAFVYEHIKTGAKVCVLSNSDENKAFFVGFKTLPKDDSGVMHILEHSVLSGSKKYPVRDPFVELCKSSLNNFLNAMTFPDKTLYPFASVNTQDFKNIMDIYMDAVFNPRIKDIPYIFMQEGKHYEISDDLETLDVNGVVYNEMKGVYSTADGLLDFLNMSSSFESGPYCYESGGSVDGIPKLTYEQFKETYDEFYNPSNAFIFMYGDMDYEERLIYLDREFLSHYGKSPVHDKTGSRLKDSECFIEESYSIDEDEYDGENDYLAMNIALPGCNDRCSRLAMEFIDSALGDSSFGILHNALIKAGIGNDVYTSFDCSLEVPIFNVVARNTKAEKIEEFRNIIETELKRIAEEGFDKVVLESSLTRSQFRFREADYGKQSKGLIYGINVMESWLYGKSPIEYLRMESVYSACREYLKTDYYEKLLKENLIDNPHISLICLKADLNKAEKDRIKYRAMCDEILKGMSHEDRLKLREENKRLREYQNKKDTKEELRTIPVLKVSDIKKTVLPAVNEELIVNSRKVLFHDIDTNKISYLRLLFDVNCIKDEDYKYAHLAAILLGELDTVNYTHSRLNTSIYLKTGDLFTSILLFDVKKTGQNLIRFTFSLKYMSGGGKDAIELLKEVAFNTLFEDKERIREVLEEEYASARDHYSSSGNRLGISICKASLSELHYMDDMTRGYHFFRFLSDLLDYYDEKIDEVLDKLKEVYEKILSADYLVDFTGKRELLDEMTDNLFAGKCFEGNAYESVKTGFKKQKVRLALTTASKVNYNCLVANPGLENRYLSGKDVVMSQILSYGYIWHNIRELGGAYGGSISFDSLSLMGFSSYRDPKIAESYNIYMDVLKAVENIDLDDEEIEKNVVGTMGSVDSPVTPYERGRRSLTYYLSEISDETRQNTRDEILSFNKDDFKGFLERYKNAFDDYVYVTVGDREEIEKNKELFDEIRPLFTGEEDIDE